MTAHTYDFKDGSGMLWRFEGSRPISQLADQVMDEMKAELWNADPNCDHEIIYPPGGGIACAKCRGWKCL